MTSTSEKQNKSSLSSMELLAEAQSTAILELENKLNKLEEENKRLEEKQHDVEAEMAKKEAEAIRRCISSEFRLAQAESFMPYKRPRVSKACKDLESGKSSILSLLHRNGLLNPAVNVVYKKACDSAKMTQTRLKQSCDDLIAWKFLPDSPAGKRLMTCMRKLLTENESLGRANEVDRITTSESEAAMQATCISEFIKTNQELESVLDESSIDLEGLQSSLLVLKQQLNQAEATIEGLKTEYELHRPGQADSLIAAALASLGEMETGLPEEFPLAKSSDSPLLEDQTPTKAEDDDDDDPVKPAEENTETETVVSYASTKLVNCDDK